MKKAKFLLALGLGLCIAMPMMASAETYPVSKTELVNVAEFKPIVSTDIHAVEEYAIEKLTDGDRGTFIVAECGPSEAATEEITVDLLRRCKIEKIELYDRFDVDIPEGRQYVDILGANKADFSDAVVLGSFGARDDDIFPHQGKLQFNLDGKSAYRYIKLKRTGGENYQYAELRVWAKQTMTDVARGAGASQIISDALSDNSHWIYDFAPPKAAFDGDSATMWLEDGSAFRYLRVDLGKQYPIGLIELNARADGVDTFWSRKYINIYGTNNASTENTIFDPNLAPDDAALAEDGFNKLITVGVNNVVDSECAFPGPNIPDGYDETTYGKTGYLQSTCDESEPSQYLIFKNYLSMGAAISNFSAYVIHPEALDAKLEGDKITVGFTDEMDENSATDENVKVYVDNTLIEDTDFLWVDDYTLEITLDKLYYDAGIEVILSEDMENSKGTKMFEDKTLNLIAPAPVEVIDFKFTDDAEGKGEEKDSLSGLNEVSVSFKMKNNTTDKPDTVTVLALFLDKDNVVKASREFRATIEPNKPPTEVVLGAELDGTIEKFKVFVWRDYDEMKPYILSKTITK